MSNIDRGLPKFSITRIRRGYERTQVDDLIRRIHATLAGADGPGVPVTAADVRMAEFHTTLFRTGYDEEEVDDALEGFAEQLDRRQG